MTKIGVSDILIKVSDDICLLRLVVRTSGFHPDNSSSILLGDVNKNAHHTVSIFVLRVFALLAKGSHFFGKAKKTGKTRVCWIQFARILKMGGP